jgi:hypothetical protein
MKAIVSTLIALSVLAGVAGSASADISSKNFFEQQERARY